MKTEYQFIHFEKIEDSPRHMWWSCHENKTCNELGEVRWFLSWKQYAFWPNENSVYSVGCLKDIAAFIAQLT